MIADASITVPTCRFSTSKATENTILCHCAGVTEGEVRGVIEAGLARTIEDVMATTGAGTGCRGCHCRIQRVLDGLPARCGGRFDWCQACCSLSAVCHCHDASTEEASHAA